MKSRLKEDIVIYTALEILEERLRRDSNQAIRNVKDTRSFLILKLAEKQHEVFSALFLDNRHRLIEFVELFQGSIDSCSIPPREVVKLTLQYNASAVIFAHNHPSGVAEPSNSDIQITDKLRQSLSLIDVRVLDHFIIGDTKTVSLAERGLIWNTHPILVMGCMYAQLWMKMTAFELFFMCIDLCCWKRTL